MRLSRVFALVALLAAAGCHVHEHHVGNGSAGVGEASKRQWYLFLGMMRLNTVEAQRYAFDRPSYSIRSAFTFSDFLITAVMLPLTVTTRTVTVSW